MKVLKWIMLLGVAAMAFLAGGWLLRRGVAVSRGASSSAAQSVASNNRLFSSVVQTVRTYAVDSLDESSIYRLATSGMLSELGDPYAGLIPDADTLAARTRVGPGPVQGAYLDHLDDFVVVVAVIPGSPAAQAGMRSGDAVLRVDRVVIGTQRPEQVARMLDGAAGTSVKIRLGREHASGPLVVTLVRGAVPPLPAPSFTGADGIGYLKLLAIDQGAVAAAVDAAARMATLPGRRGLILDLRGAASGALDEAIRLADLFLPKGQPIVVTRGRNGKDLDTVRDTAPVAGPDYPLIVLTDRGTAGPAEVVAGALQDHDRAVLLGEETFGRGARYSFYPVGDGTSLRLTTGVWVSPSGRVIQRMPAPGKPDAVPADSAPPRPKFKTDGGRIVLGGGGITPDREIVGGVEREAGDGVLAAAKDLLARAASREALIAAVKPKKD